MASVVPDLSPRLQDTLAAFAASGVVLSPAEIVWLAELRRPCDKPSDGSIPWVMGAPIRDSGETFWPLHELASNWFSRAYKIVSWSDVGGIACYLFAHTRSAPGDKSLRLLSGSEEIRTTVLDWYEQSGIHQGQLAVLSGALNRLNGVDNDVPNPDATPTQDDSAPVDNSARFAAAMCHAFPGSTPEYWLTEIPSTVAVKMLAEASGSGQFATSPERTRAISNYLTAVKTLWRMHSGE